MNEIVLEEVSPGLMMSAKDAKAYLERKEDKQEWIEIVALFLIVFIQFLFILYLISR